MPRKKRPREYVIADLSVKASASPVGEAAPTLSFNPERSRRVNYVERYAFLCGHSVERVEYDYGYDLLLFTYDDQGEIENGLIYIQLKATDSLSILADQKTISFTLTRSDLELWLFEPMPCILIVYDAQDSQAYWLYLQAYFESLDGFDISKTRESMTIRLPKANILNQEAIKKFAKFKNDVLSQLQGVIRHNG